MDAPHSHLVNSIANQSQSLANLLKNLPDGFKNIENLIGETISIHPRDIPRISVMLGELACSIRGNSEDYINLVESKLHLTAQLKSQEKIKEYRDIERIVDNALKTYNDNHTLTSLRGIIYTRIATDDSEMEPTDKIRLYKKAICDLNKSIRYAADRIKLEWLGYTRIHLGDYLEGKSRLYQYNEAQKCIKRASSFEKTQCGYCNLAEIQIKKIELWYLDSSLSTESQREKMRQKAIDNYREAYKLQNNPNILKKIKEIESMVI